MLYAACCMLHGACCMLHVTSSIRPQAAIATPLSILLAAACYAKASPRLHGRLLNHRFLGPMVRDWETHRSLTRRSKTVAQVSMVAMVGLSAWGLRERPVVLAIVLIAAAVGVLVVASIPTRKP